MTLFAALTAPTSGDPSSSYSSCSPPEAVQLYSSRLIDFLHGTTVSLASSPANASEPADVSPVSPAKSNANAAAPSDGVSHPAEESTLSDKQRRQLQARYFSALSYQAVQVRQEDSPSWKPQTALSSWMANAQRHTRPDLGIWDCRVALPKKGDEEGKEVEASGMLLRRVVARHPPADSSNGSNEEEKKSGENTQQQEGNKARVVLFAIDLTDPSEVQPTMEQMRNVVLNIFDSDLKTASSAAISQESSDLGTGGYTTSINSLRSSQFGNIVDPESKEDAAPKPSSSSSSHRIGLVVCVVVPPSLPPTSSPADAYRERQARALVLYHLHKFALEVDCTLCFVSSNATSTADPGDGTTEEAKQHSGGENDPLLGRNSTMSVEELGKVIRRVAMGMPPIEKTAATQKKEGTVSEGSDGDTTEESNKEGGIEDVEKESQIPPSIHAPGSHDAELIHGAYLRNASCEGRWDAGRDALNVALPPRSSIDRPSTNSNNKSNSSGDEEWLSKLASSIGLTSIDASSPGNASGITFGTPVDGKKKDSRRDTLSKKKSLKSAKKADGKNKNDEVLSFFDNLRKK